MVAPDSFVFHSSIWLTAIVPYRRPCHCLFMVFLLLSLSSLLSLVSRWFGDSQNTPCPWAKVIRIKIRYRKNWNKENRSFHHCLTDFFDDLRQKFCFFYFHYCSLAFCHSFSLMPNGKKRKNRWQSVQFFIYIFFCCAEQNKRNLSFNNIIIIIIILCRFALDLMWFIAEQFIKSSKVKKKKTHAHSRIAAVGAFILRNSIFPPIPEYFMLIILY